MTPIMPRLKQRAAFTLTEIAIVLSVIGLIIGGVWIAAANISATKKTQLAMSEVTQIVNGFRTLYNAQGVDVSVGTDVTCMAMNAGLFPSEMINSTVTCDPNDNSTWPGTPWGGPSYVKTIVQPSPSAVRIEYYQLTYTQCIAFANAVSFSTDLLWEKINSSIQWLTVNANNPAWTPDQISQLCVDGANTVHVMYGLQ